MQLAKGNTRESLECVGKGGWIFGFSLMGGRPIIFSAEHLQPNPSQLTTHFSRNVA